MAGNPYEVQGQNNPGTENRMYGEPNHPNEPKQPYPPQQGQQFHGIICASCNQVTESYQKKGVGNITWIWCFLLCIFTGLCCWIPFICDDCKEDQIICAKCHQKKKVL